MLLGIPLLGTIFGCGLVRIVKPSGCHCSDALGGETYRRVPTPLRSTSPFSDPCKSYRGSHESRTPPSLGQEETTTLVVNLFTCMRICPVLLTKHPQDLSEDRARPQGGGIPKLDDKTVKLHNTHEWQHVWDVCHVYVESTRQQTTSDNK